MARMMPAVVHPVTDRGTLTDISVPMWLLVEGNTRAVPMIPMIPHDSPMIPNRTGSPVRYRIPEYERMISRN
jgi:hypothetical protein